MKTLIKEIRLYIAEKLIYWFLPEVFQVARIKHDLFAEHQEIWINVLNERIRQNKKFGSQRHQHPFLWNAILTEEVGEVAKAALEAEFSHAPIEDYRKELIEVAAVAIAAILDLDTHGKYDNLNRKQ